MIRALPFLGLFLGAAAEVVNWLRGGARRGRSNMERAQRL